MMCRQTVIGIQQLHPSGTAVIERPICRIPGSHVCGRTQELITQRCLQQVIRDVELIVPEIGELIVLCLKEEDVVEMISGCIVDAVGKQFAALQDDGLRFDARSNAPT